MKQTEVKESYGRVGLILGTLIGSIIMVILAALGQLVVGMMVLIIMMPIGTVIGEKIKKGPNSRCPL